MTESKQDEYREGYRSGVTPWDTGRPDFNLLDVVEQTPVHPCKALDVGCGFGHNSVWLSERGFAVTGIDVSEVALDHAKELAAHLNVKCVFMNADIFKADIPGALFEFIFDRGCFHSFDTGDERRKFAERIAFHLSTSGIWFSIIGSADEVPGRPGPPRRSARDVVVAVEPFFEILSLTASQFESNRPDPPKAWAVLMRRR